MVPEEEIEIPKRTLEYDLIKSEKIKEKVQNQEYAYHLYGALCNVDWFYRDPTKEDIDELIDILGDVPLSWGCSWRFAGGLVADLRDKGEMYLDYYCHGNEGVVHPEIASDLKELGWTSKSLEN